MPHIDRTSPLPVYQQVAAHLRESIRSGEYPPGGKLRSERELSVLYETSRVTIRQAIAELRDEGIVVAEHGRGLFVRDRPPIQRLARRRLGGAEQRSGRGAFTSDAAAHGFTPRVEVEVRTEDADEATAGLLALATGTSVLVRERLMFADERPVQMASSRLPLALVEHTPITQVDTGPGGIYARLADIGRAPAEFTELVSARMPRPEEAAALQLVDGTPVLLVTRVAYDASDVPVEANSIVLAADRYELLYDFPADG